MAVSVKTPEQQISELQSRIQEYEQRIEDDQILRSITRHSPANIMFLDLDGCIQYINHTVPGITPEEMIGLCLPKIVEEQFQAGIQGALDRVVDSGEPDRYETSYTSPSGDVSWWESQVAPVFRDEEVTGFVVISSNITETRNAYKEQESFFNLSVDMMCVASVDGYFKRVNQAFKKTLGYDKELLDQPFRNFIHPDDLERTLDAVTRQTEEGEVILDFTNRYRASDGSYRLLNWRSTADPDGQVMFALARDITDEQALQDQLQQSNRLEAIGQLAGGIAHDFNNLLTAIQGNIELARVSPEKSESVLQSALVAIEKASSLTNQLLVFSRHQTMSRQSLYLGPLIDSLLTLLNRLIPENISLKLKMQEDLPPVWADQSQLEQLIINLCVNARDAMPNGGKLRIRIDPYTSEDGSEFTSPIDPGDYLKLSISDNGTGMAEEVKLHIFEPFFTTKDKDKGTGLGLATVYGIVKKHAGHIDVESSPGEGTTFNVYLPVGSDSSTNKTSATSPEPKKIEGGVETVLIAEDEAIVREVAEQILLQAGYTVLTAHNGQQALEIYQKNRQEIAMVMLDVVMPKLGGLETAEKLRELNPDIKVLFCSGHVAHTGDLERLESEHFLAKPYQSKDLLAFIRQVLD